MSGRHTGNLQPDIDREEHRSLNGVDAKATMPYGQTAALAKTLPLLVTDNGDGTGTLASTATFSGTVAGSPTFKDDPTSAGETAKFGKRNSSTLKPYVEADLNQVGGATFALGQQLATSSLPIVLTAAQLSTLTPTATATSVKQDPLAKYKIADEDSLLATKYFGFTTEVSANTNWIILKEVVGATTNQYRYANLSNNAATSYTTAWTNRATVVFDYLYNLTGV